MHHIDRYICSLFLAAAITAPALLVAEATALEATVQVDVLQLSELLAGYVKESGNDSPTRDLQMAADRTRPHPLCGPVVSSLLCLATIQNAPGAVHTQEFADIRT